MNEIKQTTVVLKDSVSEKVKNIFTSNKKFYDPKIIKYK
jgi:hypothetical protein